MNDEKEKEKEKEKEDLQQPAILSHLLFLDDEILKTDQHLEKMENRIALLENKMAWINESCFTEGPIYADDNIATSKGDSKYTKRRRIQK